LKNYSKQSFDSAAKQYDDVFTFSEIGMLQRQRVYHWLDRSGFFSSSKRIFEINCGTGYDAEQFVQRGHEVIATDDSAEMTSEAKQKRNLMIDFQQLSFHEVANHPNFAETNVLFSNFGGLNCINHRELKQFTSDVANNQSRGDQLIWVLMPKICMIESIYFLLKLQLKKAFRRNTSSATVVNVQSSSIPTFYHSPKEVREMLEENYMIILIKPVAIFLPPSYFEEFFGKHKAILNFLNRLESVFGSISRLASWSDHFIIIAEKK